MINAEQNIIDAGYAGAVHKVELFTLQAHIASSARSGRNLILAGDAVGVGHWEVGGGMHIAGVCHSKRLGFLVNALSSDPNNMEEHLKEYSKEVTQDSLAWISRSIKNYYLNAPGTVVKAAFDLHIGDLMSDNNIDFPELLRDKIVSAYLK